MASSTMQSKHRKTLEGIFTDPFRANVPWADVEALFLTSGAKPCRKAGDRGCG